MKILLPGSTIGMLGGGQLGRMFTLKAKQMGYRVITFEPKANAPCGQVSDLHIQADYTNKAAIQDLGAQVDVVTYEFENVSAQATQWLKAMGKPVHPNPDILVTTKNRLKEKTFVRNLGIEVTDFVEVNSAADLNRAVDKVGLPAVLKTSTGGYDGKGQIIIEALDEARNALEQFSGQLIWEKLAPFSKEISVIAARNRQGEIVTYPAIENIHQDNMLDISIAPARVSEKVQTQAQAIARKILDGLDFVGTCGVEMFVLPDERILVNEIAPRPHNSGHLTIEACPVSQFEQQLRAICGLPLGQALLHPHSAAVMVNIIGTGQGNQLHGIEDILTMPQVNFHLYGKDEAAPKRKMGHITVLADSVEAALELALKVRQKLHWETIGRPKSRPDLGL